VYVGSNDKKLYAVDAATGQQKWAFTTGGNVESSPVVSADGAVVYVGSDDSKLYAVWTRPTWVASPVAASFYPEVDA
jgi:outer membrane protein assembly factor BamB